jgi:hypothetical protein
MLRILHNQEYTHPNHLTEPGKPDVGAYRTSDTEHIPIETTRVIPLGDRFIY